MTMTSYQHEEDEDDAEFIAASTDTSSHPEGKSAEQKPSNYRSKHSETEQRRRNKINDRFQILRGLIPPNDQKRDKASLLLEVIEYIQFLKEKLEVYEGSYQQAWTQDPSKLIPWIANHGPVDNFDDHSQGMKNGSLDEDIVSRHMTGTHESFESEFSGEFVYRGADVLSGPKTPGVPFPSCGLATGRSIMPAENLVSQPHFFSIAERSVFGNEDRAYESSSSSISNVYSQGVLRKLTQALQTSGVDLSQTNISVQLDVGKRENSGSMAVTTTGDVGNGSPTSQLRSHSVDVSVKGSAQTIKRLRTGES